MSCDITLAVAEGFEPSEVFTSRAFEVCGPTLGTSPPGVGTAGQGLPSASLDVPERT